MERLLNVIRKILLACNWTIFGVLSVIFFIAANSAVKQADNEGVSPFMSEWWFPYITIVSDNPDQAFLIWIAVGCLLIGFVSHLVIQWIFK
tara:strand:+ start:413 stop:685 length:273 start_codon:yes stop_codon:yes gene_type:complete